MTPWRYIRCRRALRRRRERLVRAAKAALQHQYDKLRAEYVTATNYGAARRLSGELWVLRMEMWRVR